MTDRELLVYVDLDGTAHLTGRLWAHQRRGREGARFEYDDGWVAHRERFALEPALVLGPGTFHTCRHALVGSIGDSAPDRWGRALMRRAERRRAARAGETARTLREIDFLEMVDDEAPGRVALRRRAGRRLSRPRRADPRAADDRAAAAVGRVRQSCR